jgi:anti-sigma regulatory factor (Ser/Thr protein kinase)
MPTGLPQTIRLDPAGESVATARSFADGCLARWGLSEQTDDVQLIVDELVTNAIQHGRGPVTLAIGRRPDRIVVQVQDPSRTPPEHGPGDLLADSGRGLLLVEELASEWGTTQMPDGKRVWAEVSVD